MPLPASRLPDTMDTDYLVIGAGATSMSFIDTLIDSSDSRIVVVDRHAQPGGHWNDAYPFVRLHQPSVWYGVPSLPLPNDQQDADVYGRGATGAELLEYFAQLMRNKFLSSRRVQWLPRTEYIRGAEGVYLIRSVDTGETRTVRVKRKLVDATLTRTEVPSTRAPQYSIATGVHHVPPNALPAHLHQPGQFTVIGGGKTAMDACLFLLDSGVDQSAIRWIIPRDAWLMDRAHMLPGAEHFAESLRGFIAHYEAIAEAGTLDGLFTRLEDRGVLHRLDQRVKPLKIRGAVSSLREMDRLRSIENVVRHGRVLAIDSARMSLEGGTIDIGSHELFVDCSASAAVTPHNLPVFEGDVVRLLMVVWGQPMLSASLIAHVEATVDDELEQNALCGPVISPQTVHDWLPMWAATIRNAGNWRANPAVHAWIRSCRLHVPTMMTQGVPADHPDLQRLMKEMGSRVSAAANRLRQMEHTHTA